MQTEFRHLGTSDDVTSCDCCGRKDLNSTVALEIDGAVVYYGVTCAANALTIPATEIRQGAKLADDAKRAAEQAIFDNAREKEFSRWSNFCRANGTGSDLFTQIQSIGGYAVAKALYGRVNA